MKGHIISLIKHMYVVYFLNCVYMSYKFSICVYMSFNIKRHIHTSVISWCVYRSYTGRLILSCSVPARTQDFKNFIINPSVLLQDLHNALVRCLISLLVCAVLYVTTLTPFFISSPECVHLFPSTCKPLFMFWHLILHYPSSYCIPHAIIERQMTILISYFPCLAARFFPREDCSIRPLAPLVAYLRTRMSAPHSLVLLDVLSIWPTRMLSPLSSSFVVSGRLLPIYPRQVPPTLQFHLYRSTYWLSSTITGCHTNTATAPLSGCHEALVKTLPIQANLSLSPLPLVPVCTAAFSFLKLLHPALILPFLSEPSSALTWPWNP